MSAAASQIRVALGQPIDPRSLAESGLTAIERGRAYNEANLDSWQRACIEDALRMVEAGTYPEAVR